MLNCIIYNVVQTTVVRTTVVPICDVGYLGNSRDFKISFSNNPSYYIGYSSPPLLFGNRTPECLIHIYKYCAITLQKQHTLPSTERINIEWNHL